VLSEQLLTLILVEIQALNPREAHHDGQNYTERESPVVLRLHSPFNGSRDRNKRCGRGRGGGIGALVGTRLAEALRHTAAQAIGIGTLFVGIANSLRFDRASTQIVPTSRLVAVL
jgi:hypothetical protein